MKVYALRSTNGHGSYIMDYRCNPRVFSTFFHAWLYKARLRKWHWMVVAHPSSEHLLERIGMRTTTGASELSS